MGTFCPKLSGFHTTAHYGSCKNTGLSMIFQAILHSSYVLGLNSYDILTDVLSYVVLSRLLKVYNFLALMSRSLIVPDSNFAHTEEVATW